MAKKIIETTSDDAKAKARHAKLAKERENAEEKEKNRASDEYWKNRRVNEKRKEEITKLPKEERAEAKRKLREDVRKNREQYRQEKKAVREKEREARKAEREQTRSEDDAEAAPQEQDVPVEEVKDAPVKEAEGASADAQPDTPDEAPAEPVEKKD